MTEYNYWYFYDDDDDDDEERERERNIKQKTGFDITKFSLQMTV